MKAKNKLKREHRRKTSWSAGKFRAWQVRSNALMQDQLKEWKRLEREFANERALDIATFWGIA